MKNLLLAVAIAIPLNVYAAFEGTLSCDAEKTVARLLKEPRADAEAVTTVACPAHVWAFDPVGEWSKVRSYANGKEGFVPVAKLKEGAPPPMEQVKADSTVTPITMTYETTERNRLWDEQAAAEKAKAAERAFELEKARASAPIYNCNSLDWGFTITSTCVPVSPPTYNHD